MRVKVILKIIKIVLILGVTYFIILGIQTIKIESNFFESPHGIVRMLEKYELVRCDWNIFNPEFALVMFTDEELGSVELYKFNKTFMNDEEIKNIESFFWLSYIPATFEELLEKVYSDCQYFENRNYEMNYPAASGRGIKVPSIFILFKIM